MSDTINQKYATQSDATTMIQSPLTKRGYFFYHNTKNTQPTYAIIQHPHMAYTASTL